MGWVKFFSKKGKDAVDLTQEGSAKSRPFGRRSGLGRGGRGHCEERETRGEERTEKGGPNLIETQTGSRPNRK